MGSRVQGMREEVKDSTINWTEYYQYNIQYMTFLSAGLTLNQNKNIMSLGRECTMSNNMLSVVSRSFCICFTTQHTTRMESLLLSQMLYQIQQCWCSV